MSVSSAEPLRVLLVKPYQRARLRIACPPLGLLYLASTLRQMFGRDIEVRLLDLMLEGARYFDAREVLQEFRPHVVGLSALNWEAEESGRLALMIQTEFPGTIVAIGGPFTHGNTQKIWRLASSTGSSTAKRIGRFQWPASGGFAATKRWMTLSVLPGGPHPASHSPTTLNS